MRRSTDGGRSFDSPRRIADVPGPHRKNPVALAQGLAATNDVTYNNPVLIPDAKRRGVVHMVFNLEYMRAFYQRSEDDGISWSKPVEITKAFDEFRPEYDWKVLATGPGHGIQLRNGRLVIPVWLSLGTGGHAHRPSVVSTIHSDDGGATWRRGDIAIPNTEEWVNPSETALVELRDGRVMLNARTESKVHRRLVAVSADGARGWSRPSFDDALPEPVCFGSVVRHPRAGILFVNPDNRVDRTRRNVTVRLSRDEGKTWAAKRSVEPGGSGYADIAVAKDGTVLTFYERNEDVKGRWRTQALVLARFGVDWLSK
jgi:sialidase-1